MVDKRPQADELAADGDDVLEGTHVLPSQDDVAAVETFTPEELQKKIDAHIAEVDEWKAAQ